jgi:hypothetical protein
MLELTMDSKKLPTVFDSVEEAIDCIVRLAEYKFGITSQSHIMDSITVGSYPPGKGFGWQVWLTRPTELSLYRQPMTLKECRNQQTVKNYASDTFFYVDGGRRSYLETLGVLYDLLQKTDVINGVPARYKKP